jgi:glucose/arabinose dehydrogenase
MLRSARYETDHQIRLIHSKLKPLRRHQRRAAVAALVGGLVIATGCASGATDPATDVSDTGATLRAHGSADGKPTNYWFEYGTSPSYGSSTPHRAGGSGTAVQDVSERVTGLSPDTLYHYHACADNADGGGCGEDVTFRTGSAGLLPGFQDTVAFSGLESPTTLRFSPDGRVFVAEKSGIIKVYDGLDDPSPSVFADLRTEVHNFWDRGLLGMALDPDFPAQPYVYVLYTHDAAIGATAPRWGAAGQTGDGCPDPPGATSNGCVVSGRLARLVAEGNQAGPEQVLIEDWCQQYPSHSIGDIEFGADGMLYATGGDGASFNFVDYGWAGSPRNPCGDPPGGVGGAMTPPRAQGGALRAQDVRGADDPTSLDGTLIRVDPKTGEGLPDNPLAASPDPDARRISAYGFRNPFRFAIRPGTSEPWVGDVGWETWEEINRIPDPTGPVKNFGWPCFEGNLRQGGYDAADLNLCEKLYTAATPPKVPLYTYNHSAKVYPEETCPTGSSSVTGLEFTPPGTTLPAEFRGALFFGDYSRRCIWVMERDGTSTRPSPARIRAFRTTGPGPTDLRFGPGGDLFYADFSGGTIRRIHYSPGNQPPRAVVGANPTDGNTTLHVDFTAGGSSDPDPGDTISYAWDLDGDGQYDDATGATAAFDYATAGSYLAGVQVTDNHGASATDSVAITAGNTPPTATITSPSPGLTWKVADPIAFAGRATDEQDGDLAPARFSWKLVIQHCPSNCHEHTPLTWAGVDHESFPAPDHEYPSYLELTLTATDSGGLTDTRTIRLDPKTVVLSFASNPSALTLALNGTTFTTPFTSTVIMGSANSLAAPTPQTVGSDTYDFGSWSDGGARVHAITANADRSFTATYNKR